MGEICSSLKNEGKKKNKKLNAPEKSNDNIQNLQINDNDNDNEKLREKKKDIKKNSDTCEEIKTDKKPKENSFGKKNEEKKIFHKPENPNRTEENIGKYFNYSTKEKIESISSLTHFKETCLPSVGGDSNSSTVLIEAIIGYKEYPIYIKKKESICIVVENMKSNNMMVGCTYRWSFLPGSALTDYLGHRNKNYNNKNVGSILFKISGSDKEYSITEKKTQFTADSTGSLLIGANLDPDDYSYYEPSGSLQLSVFGGKRMTDDEIDKITEYDLCKYKDENSLSSQEFDIEIQILRYINKARKNLKKFINDFIKINHNNPEAQKEIDKIIENYGNTKVGELKPNKLLTEVAQEHCDYLSSNGTSGHNEKNCSSVKERISQYMNVENCGESIIYRFNNPLLIVDNLIFDDYSNVKENRRNVLSGHFTKVGINIKEHITYKYCCVIVFAS